jgi:hypothetical protein
VSQLLYHATLSARIPSILKSGLLPRFGPFAHAAHGKPCPLHPQPARIHVTRTDLDPALYSALCFHVIRYIQAILQFDDADLVWTFEPGWLLAKDLAAFGALIEVDVPDEEVHYQERRHEICTCLEDGDLYLTRPTRIKQFWTHGYLFRELNKPRVVETFRTWLEVDRSGTTRMDDGTFLFEFRPDELAQPCPNAEARLRRLRSKYSQAVTDLHLVGQVSSS